MHLENRYLGIWYELFQNKVKLFIRGCDGDVNQSLTFNGVYVALYLTQGGITFNDGYLTRITTFLHCETLATRGSAAAPFWLW